MAYINYTPGLTNLGLKGIRFGDIKVWIVILQRGDFQRVLNVFRNEVLRFGT